MLPDPDQVLTIVYSYQGKQPSDRLGKPVLRNFLGHAGGDFALFLNRYPLVKDSIQMCFLFVEMDVEMKAEGGGGTSSLNRVAGTDIFVKPSVQRVETAMVFLVGLRYQRGDLFDCREHEFFFSIGMPDENVVEELVSLDHRIQTAFSVGCGICGLIDSCNVGPKCIVDSANGVKRNCHVFLSSYTPACHPTSMAWHISNFRLKPGERSWAAQGDILQTSRKMLTDVRVMFRLPSDPLNC